MRDGFILSVRAFFVKLLTAITTVLTQLSLQCFDFGFQFRQTSHQLAHQAHHSLFSLPIDGSDFCFAELFFWRLFAHGYATKEWLVYKLLE